MKWKQSYYGCFIYLRRIWKGGGTDRSTDKGPRCGLCASTSQGALDRMCMKGGHKHEEYSRMKYTVLSSTQPSRPYLYPRLDIMTSYPRTTTKSMLVGHTNLYWMDISRTTANQLCLGMAQTKATMRVEVYHQVKVTDRRVTMFQSKRVTHYQ